MFVIAYQKADLELQAATTKARYNEEESLARIAAICAPMISTGLIQIREDEKVSIGEISPIIFSVPDCYSGLPKAKITQIYKNRFKPENLYKLCHLKSRENKDRDENITFELSQMKI